MPEILAACAEAGAFAWRNNTGAMRWKDSRGRMRLMRFGKVGSSDVLGVLPGGRFLAIEAKRRPNKPTPSQVEFLGRVAKMAGVALVVTDRVGRLAEMLVALAKERSDGDGQETG